MNANKNSEVSPPDYPVIFHVNNPGPMNKVVELSTILDHFHLFESNQDDPVPNTLLQNACCGSSFGGASARLTMRQLFEVWRSGKLVHSSYYDQDGKEIHEKLFVVGIGIALSGAYVFSGIVPSRKTIVISDRSPMRGVWDISSNMRLYKNAANPWKTQISQADEISEREWLGPNDFRSSVYSGD